MEIIAQIVEGIKYISALKIELSKISFENLNVNSARASCLVEDGQNHFAVSKWVSPKRTRSYPYERVYNNFAASKRLTIIPVVKDEGTNGDRDFLQWDTVSLMSLLDVYVILAYYKTAEKHRSRPGKITNQKFDEELINSKIKEISNYHSSALHWNLMELKNIANVLDKAKNSYQVISENTNVKFHNEKNLELFAASVRENLTAFMESSRTKAKLAQAREFMTTQPKEILATQTKAKLTISNYYGGIYHFTVDEIVLENEIW